MVFIYLGASDKAIKLSFFLILITFFLILITLITFSEIGLTNFIAFQVPKKLHHIVFMLFPLFENNC